MFREMFERQQESEDKTKYQTEITINCRKNILYVLDVLVGYNTYLASEKETLFIRHDMHLDEAIEHAVDKAREMREKYKCHEIENQCNGN